MASLTDVEQLADDLEGLVEELRSELKNGPDFEKLMQIADEISEHADNAAQTFNSVNETLMSRLDEIRRGSKKSASGASQAREKATSSASSS
jgi:hypothetical protein